MGSIGRGEPWSLGRRSTGKGGTWEGALGGAENWHDGA